MSVIFERLAYVMKAGLRYKEGEPKKKEESEVYRGIKYWKKKEKKKKEREGDSARAEDKAMKKKRSWC